MNGNRKSGVFLRNGALLAVLLIIYIVYTSTNYTWSIGLIVVAVLIAAMSAFQFWLYFHFFKNNS
jgi:hypothetical protein